MFTADRLEVRILVENWVDMLLPDLHIGDASQHCVTRTGLIEHFDPKLTAPQAENGISLLVRATRGARTYTTLFDVGLTGSVLAHNLRALGEDPTTIDHVVISHGHPDHYGGIDRFLGELDRAVPVATHPDAFLPRYAVMADGRTSPFYNAAFNQESLSTAGARFVLVREPLELGCGVRTTGEIPRLVDYEGPRPPAAPGDPGLYQVAADGRVGLDEVTDEQALVIDVAGEGLVVLTGCAHAGVINTLHRARQISGEKPIRAVIGGFHLGFPTTPAENVDKTVEAMRDLEVQMIVPMHCSGLRAHAAFSSTLPRQYVQPSVGSSLWFGK
ncbi:MULTISPECIES: MBL fold metallo-hydrolase [unclassified Mycobacterium]|uniref:MBL fold metallo-hydrolase n=1 Tax=unclassified Mycobacterium TaxID=2642494 RepID=UPI0029C99751|nr:MULTISPECIES: MBL fold metallo-hydrolase [unclassified Mycobacterium]